MPWLIVLSILLISSTAFAQQNPPPPDPRISGQAITALQAMVALKDAQIKAMMEDHQREIANLMTKCGDPCKPSEEEKK